MTTIVYQWFVKITESQNLLIFTFINRLLSKAGRTSLPAPFLKLTLTAPRQF